MLILLVTWVVCLERYHLFMKKISYRKYFFRCDGNVSDRVGLGKVRSRSRQHTKVNKVKCSTAIHESVLHRLTPKWWIASILKICLNRQVLSFRRNSEMIRVGVRIKSPPVTVNFWEYALAPIPTCHSYKFHKHITSGTTYRMWEPWFPLNR